MNLLFVSMSDLHLGEEDSVLTNLSLGEPVPQPNGPGPCMLALVNYFHAIKGELNQGKPIPYLILNGDILELATSTYPISTTYFRLFLTELAKRKLFDRLIYLPGNHDHSLWSLIRDTHFVKCLSQQSEISGQLKVEHITQLSIPRQSPLLSLLASNLPMQIISPSLLVANPSFRLQSLKGHDFLFHHGHLLEDIYKFLTLLRDRLIKDVSLSELKEKPLRDKIGELEGENWPWIDFVWSGFVRAGKVGYTMEDIYELLRKPEGMRKLIKRIGDVLRTEFNIPIIPEKYEDDIFRFIMKKALEKGGVGSDERADHEKPAFSENLKSMTCRFMYHYMKQELSDEGLRPATDQSHFIFGHTHKPFLGKLQDDESGFGTITVVNSGGWVIESDGYLPKHAPGIVFGTNTGDIALVKYKLDVKPDLNIDLEVPWTELGQLAEHKQLAIAISKAVEVRWRYFKKRVKKTKKILKNLSK
ncbi:MAG: metallophosphoesterase [Planctomycetota bacterium]|jgi:UDP-2,3-diacylglucosamine pyrophosphatase LpxH